MGSDALVVATATHIITRPPAHPPAHPHHPPEKEGGRGCAFYHVPLAVHRSSSFKEGAHRAPLAFPPRPAVVPCTGASTAVTRPTAAAGCFRLPRLEGWVSLLDCVDHPDSSILQTHATHILDRIWIRQCWGDQARVVGSIPLLGAKRGLKAAKTGHHSLRNHKVKGSLARGNASRVVPRGAG
jgi:hypothetical protein